MRSSCQGGSIMVISMRVHAAMSRLRSARLSRSVGTLARFCDIEACLGVSEGCTGLPGGRPLMGLPGMLRGVLVPDSTSESALCCSATSRVGSCAGCLQCAGCS